ncbi:Protein tyrosine kinase [Musa troglodytarum]|uniref:Protein tyrosine kinase n=1 Tax=Musa troglodytarum TaxID=320322 RepID=A0A9E7E7L9_9LILI|nr:Protein tyrosine kinase [Musa troglodytarum]
MKGVLSAVLILELTTGVVIGMLLVTGAVLWIMSHKKRAQESPRHSDSKAGGPFWMKGTKRKKLPKYSFKDLKRATHNFETLIGQGAFGRVYKSQMPTGEIVAVKVLATNSRQGKKDFQTEVLLLGRLYHRNLVNLVGYCTEEGHHMLIYDYMTNGSLASQLYSENHNVLSWDLRVNIALDVARGLEYLHDGVRSHTLFLAEMMNRSCIVFSVNLTSTLSFNLAGFSTCSAS